MTAATILIVARNAARTIARAVRSAQEQGDWPVLVVDDQSTDLTAAVADVGGRVRVERLAEHHTLGFARQRALGLIDTEFTVLLDADDELLPGRTARLVETMQRDGTHMAFDGAEVCDGESGAFLRHAPVPGFMCGRRVPARLFERNYLPVIGPIAFRTAWVRSLGYDVGMHGAEDVDLVLRGIAAGGECSMVKAIGYRLHTYPHSLSRQIENHSTMVRYCLRKHDYSVVERLYLESGYSSRIVSWGLVFFALFRNDLDIATALLGGLERETRSSAAIAEPDGPYPYPESWRLDFQLGTVALLKGQAEAAAHRLAAAERVRPTPEVANNLGVASFQLEQSDEARQWFALALARFPGYRDAHLNAGAAIPRHITTLPFRSAPSRDDYPLLGRSPTTSLS